MVMVSQAAPVIPEDYNDRQKHYAKMKRRESSNSSTVPNPTLRYI